MSKALNQLANHFQNHLYRLAQDNDIEKLLKENPNEKLQMTEDHNWEDLTVEDKSDIRLLIQRLVRSFVKLDFFAIYQNYIKLTREIFRFKPDNFSDEVHSIFLDREIEAWFRSLENKIKSAKDGHPDPFKGDDKVAQNLRVYFQAMLDGNEIFAE